MTSLLHNVSLIIAERDSAWAAWVERLRADADDVIVVLQEQGETASALAQRVRERVADLEEREIAITGAVIVGGGRVDSDMVSARSLFIRSLTGAMARSGGGRLLLDSAGPDRFSMMGLASTVAPMVRGTGVRVAPAAVTPAYLRVA